PSRNGASYDRRFPPMTLNFPFSHASTLRGEGHPGTTTRIAAASRRFTSGRAAAEGPVGAAAGPARGAWDSGAYAWTAAQREAYATDLEDDWR
ncbi:hypothetical protein ABZ856_40760, partial [Streptomyces sp. NPDC047009]